MRIKKDSELTIEEKKMYKRKIKIYIVLIMIFVTLIILMNNNVIYADKEDTTVETNTSANNTTDETTTVNGNYTMPSALNWTDSVQDDVWEVYNTTDWETYNLGQLAATSVNIPKGDQKNFAQYQTRIDTAIESIANDGYSITNYKSLLTAIIYINYKYGSKEAMDTDICQYNTYIKSGTDPSIHLGKSQESNDIASIKATWHQLIKGFQMQQKGLVDADTEGESDNYSGATFYRKDAQLASVIQSMVLGRNFAYNYPMYNGYKSNYSEAISYYNKYKKVSTPSDVPKSYKKFAEKVFEIYEAYEFETETQTEVTTNTENEQSEENNLQK